MKQMSLCLAAALVLAFSGCGGSDSHESLAKEQVEVLKEMNAILADVKDKASVEAARSKLTALNEKGKDIDARKTKLGDVSEEEKKKITEKYGQEIMSEGMTMLDHLQRIAADPDAKKLLDELKLGKK